MLPTPSEIEGFLEIAQTLNITKAAQRLGLTQPTLSQSLKKLEHTLGSSLVIRSKNGVELTIAGKEFLKQAKWILDSWESIKSKTLQSTREVRGNIKIGCHPSVGLYTLPVCLPHLIHKHPEIEFTLIHELSRKILDRVINYEVDIGLVINPHRHPDLILTKILDDEVKIWKAPNAAEDVLIAHPDLIQTQGIMKKLKNAGRPFRRFIESENLEIITGLTLSGAGCGIIPNRIVSIFDKEELLQPILNSPIYQDELFVLHRVENKDIESIRVVKEQIIKSLGTRAKRGA